jgi:hypothetical protein
MGATSGAGTAYPKEAHEFTPGFCEIHVAQSSSCVAFSRKSVLLLKLRTLIAMYAKFIPIYAVESFVLFHFTEYKTLNLLIITVI